MEQDSAGQALAQTPRKTSAALSERNASYYPKPRVTLRSTLGAKLSYAFGVGRISDPSERGRGRPRHNVGRASSPVRLPKTGWKMSKLQATLSELDVFRTPTQGSAALHPDSAQGFVAARRCHTHRLRMARARRSLRRRPGLRSLTPSAYFPDNLLILHLIAKRSLTRDTYMKNAG